MNRTKYQKNTATRATLTATPGSRCAAKWLAWGALVGVVAVAGCASTQTPAQHASGTEGSSADAKTDMSARNDADTTIQISADFRRECQLPNAPQEAPHFDYADATLRARGANILDDVAKCLSEGPLKGRMMTIIGRTDPRGSAAYNKQLSASRADAARNYLVQRGVALANVRVIAHGERGATGSDEASWALDRRVDFELGDANVQGTPAANNLNATPSPILEGTRMDAGGPGSASKVNAASYADTAEGGKQTGASTGKSGSASASGSATGSVHAGTSK
ncbi:MAG: OmpA family protein [Polyangiaceae bacterium]